ncbi:MAG TPA: septum site-determining protein MinC [Thermomicrobiales bacterium]|nr:septum site-determining protein MinC [Thermomicrobiales bacterium]
MAQDAQAYVHDPPGGTGRSPTIRMRGTRDGLVLSLPEDARAASPKEVAAALAAHVDGAAAFFTGAEVIVDLGDRELTEDEIAFYRLVLEEREVALRGFTAATPPARALLRKQGYHPLQLVPDRTRPGAARGAAQEPGEALYLRRTLRSGARVRHHGNLVIVGDINAGAEASASGDIIIWGVVRGTVHAGALGDDSAIICALSLVPTQLRIGGHYALPPADKKADPARGPERARLEHGQLVVEPWRTK